MKEMNSLDCFDLFDAIVARYSTLPIIIAFSVFSMSLLIYVNRLSFWMPRKLIRRGRSPTLRHLYSFIDSATPMSVRCTSDISSILVFEWGIFVFEWHTRRCSVQ